MSEEIKMSISQLLLYTEHSKDDIRKRVSNTLSNRQFVTNLERSGDRNWLQIDVKGALLAIQDFLKAIG